MSTQRGQLQALHDRVPSTDDAASAADVQEFQTLARALNGELPGLCELADEAITTNDELRSLARVARDALQDRDDLLAGRPPRPGTTRYARF